MLGASNFTTEQLLNTLHQQSKNKFTAFQFVQNNNNLAISDVGIEFKKLCALYNIKIVIYIAHSVQVFLLVTSKWCTGWNTF